MAAATPAAPRPATARPSSVPPPRRAELQRQLDAIVKAGAPGALARVEDEAGSWSGVSGVGDTTNRAPMRRANRFRIGSVTKSMLAAVVLQLVAERRLGLRDTVNRWLPGLLRKNADGIEIRHLLQHTSGIYDYTRDLIVSPLDIERVCRTRYTPRQLVAIANRHDPAFEPGSRWEYSNTNYIVLGLLVEKVTGGRAGGALKRRVLDRVRMPKTYFPMTEPSIKSPHARGYMSLDPLSLGPLKRDVTRCNPSVAWTAGAAIATAPELTRFWRALLRARLVSPRLLRVMKRTVPALQGMRYGLGVAAVDTPCGVRIWGHTGGFPGWVTATFNSENGRRQIALSLNLFPGAQRIYEEAEKLLVMEFCGAGAVSPLPLPLPWSPP